jgi:hypothetical protein
LFVAIKAIRKAKAKGAYDGDLNNKYERRSPETTIAMGICQDLISFDCEKAFMERPV